MLNLLKVNRGDDEWRPSGFRLIGRNPNANNQQAQGVTFQKKQGSKQLLPKFHTASIYNS